MNPSTVISCYDDKFYENNVNGSLRSARVVVPIVVALVRIQSVVDIGCGMGTWLRAFQENGIDDLQGIDGDYVDTSKILIDQNQFRSADLRKPIVLGRRFDLAVCLEVGEHLPKCTSTVLVDSLTSAAPLILFSAAVPGQGGTAHINEQWPEYWERLFARRGYHKLDVIRPQIWKNRHIEWWYRQNILLYAMEPILSELRQGNPEWATHGQELEIISLDILKNYKTFRNLLRETLRSGARAIVRMASRS